LYVFKCDLLRHRENAVTGVCNLLWSDERAWKKHCAVYHCFFRNMMGWGGRTKKKCSWRLGSIPEQPKLWKRILSERHIGKKKELHWHTNKRIDAFIWINCNNHRRRTIAPSFLSVTNRFRHRG
jgi:hypothetical protein